MGFSIPMTVQRIELHNNAPDSPQAMISLGLHPPDMRPAATVHVTAANGSYGAIHLNDPEEIQSFAPGDELTFTATSATPPTSTPVSGQQAEPSAMPSQAAQLGGRAG